ncbi:MAG: cobalamin biosynthesis protein CbiX [Firmicutes bacterium]|nr:cobalamin biosynthesis protein CbiX [Bacillota bacterium]
MKTGIVVLGHGSQARVGEANLVLDSIAALVKDLVKEQLDLDLVEPAFMNRKSGRQGLGEAIDKVVGAGAGKVIVVPVFLTNGLHLQEDIPVELAQAREKYRGEVEIRFASHLGADRRIVEIIVDRIKEAG